MGPILVKTRYLVIVGSATALVLAAASFVWAVVKAVSFLHALAFEGGDGEDVALVKLFESIDVILVGTVLLVMGLGLWELFISQLELPSALRVSTFGELKANVATTLLLVLVVRFLENLVSRTTPEALLELAASVTLVGGLLMVFANWKPRARGSQEG